MELLTPGEKVKKLRTELGLTQDDLANEEVSKSLISMIEKNKRGLTHAVAKIIADKVNTYYEPMGKKITPEELMETEGSLIKKEIEEGIEYLKSIIDSGKVEVKLATPFFEKLLNLAGEWNLKKEMMEIIVLRGRMYYETYNYSDCLKDFSDALIYYLQERDHYQVARIYNLLGIANHMLMRMDQALSYYIRAYEDSIVYNFENDRIKIQSLSNIVLCYRKIRKFDMVLHYVNLYKELESSNPYYNKISERVLLAEANTYRDIRNFERAERLYDRLISMEEDLDVITQFLIYENYSTLYQEQGKFSKALRCIEKALSLKHIIEPSYVPMGILAQAKCQLMLNRFSEAINTLQEGLSLSKQLSDNSMIVKFYFTLVQTYIKQKNFHKALSYLNRIEMLIQHEGIKVIENDLYSFYGEVYCALGEPEKAIKYMTKLRTDYLAVNIG